MDISFLKKKEMGLPIWAWGIIVAVFMFLIYRHYKNAGGSSSSSSNTLGASTTPDTTGTAGDLSGSGGGGIGSGDTGAGVGGGTDTTGGLAALASVLEPEGAYYQTLLDQLQGGVSPNGGDSTVGLNPAAASGAGTAFDPLNWGDITYRTRSQFDAYLKSKGLTVAEFAKKHPAAYAVYRALPAGRPTSGAKSGTSGAVRASVIAAVKKTTKPAASRAAKAKAVTTPHGTPTPAKPSKAIQKKVKTVTRKPVAQTQARKPIRHTPARKTPRIHPGAN